MSFKSFSSGAAIAGKSKPQDEPAITKTEKKPAPETPAKKRD